MPKHDLFVLCKFVIQGNPEALGLGQKAGESVLQIGPRGKNHKLEFGLFANKTHLIGGTPEAPRASAKCREIKVNSSLHWHLAFLQITTMEGLTNT